MAMFVWQACDVFEDMETEACCRAFLLVAKQCAGVREEGSPSSGVTATAMQQKVEANEEVA